MKQRLGWVDVVRCFGIFAIYLGHFGNQAGRASPFVFTHHVALFFFISGCLAPRTAMSFFEYLKKIIGDLLVPWLVFAVSSAAFNTIYSNLDLQGFLEQLGQIARGTIVDHFVAGSLWFLVTLAVMKIVFWFLQKCKSNTIILAICVLLLIIEARYPIPKLYNIHRVFRYLIYYALGNTLFPYICRVLSADTKKKRWGLAFSGMFSLGYAAIIYFGENPLSILQGVPYVKYLVTVINAMVVIWSYILVAKVLENVELFNAIGRNTLYLCGSEYFIRQILKTIIRLVGLEPTYPNPMSACIYSAIMLYTAYRYLVPIEKRMIAKIKKIPNFLS